MDGLSIAQAAEATGFTPSALRFYEGRGLVTPARTSAGYRSYGPASLDTLRFIARAKRLGLSLEQIADLVVLLDDRRCGPVQDRLRTMLEHELAGAHEQVATLLAFTAQLQTAAARLHAEDPDAPCDDDCGCTTDRPAGGGPVAVGLTAEPTPAGEVPIACTLGAGELPRRLADWQVALRGATGREAIEGGVRVHLPRHAPVAGLAGLAGLADAEQACCRFLSFAITVGAAAITLDVTGPEAAQDVIRALVGSSAAAPA